METERFSRTERRKLRDDIEIGLHWKGSATRRQGIASHIHSVTHSNDACEEYMASNDTLITLNIKATTGKKTQESTKHLYST